jgi:hypothetical protein
MIQAVRSYTQKEDLKYSQWKIGQNKLMFVSHVQRTKNAFSVGKSDIMFVKLFEGAETETPEMDLWGPDIVVRPKAVVILR